MATKIEASDQVSGNRVEGAEHTNGAEAESNLGRFLIAARERRGVSREEVVNQTRIPKRYLQMMENNDYSLASDQLYVLPFMRRYATFLALDPDETAMRFVREVQRAENNPGLRIDQPLDEDKNRRKGGGWIGIVVVVVVIAVAGWLYMAESEHHTSDNAAPAAVVNSVPAAPAAPVAPSSAASPAAPSVAAANTNAGGVANAPAAPSANVPSSSQAPAVNQHP